MLRCELLAKYIKKSAFGNIKDGFTFCTLKKKRRSDLLLQSVEQLHQRGDAWLVLDGIVRIVPAGTLEPDGIASEGPGRLDVLLIAIADDGDVLRLEMKPVDSELEDGRIGLAHPYHSRIDHHTEAAAHAEVLDDRGQIAVEIRYQSDLVLVGQLLEQRDIVERTAPSIVVAVACDDIDEVLCQLVHVVDDRHLALAEDPERRLEDVLIEQPLAYEIINLNADTRLHQLEEIVTRLDDRRERNISFGIDVCFAEMLLGYRE